MSDREASLRDPKSWLIHARSDLALAENEGAGILLETLCFHAQQAAEKALKGLLIADGVWDFPYTHDIEVLVGLVERHGREPPPAVRTAAKLTTYAIDTRYPGFVLSGREEYEKAVATARVVVEWVEEQVGSDA